MVNTMFARPPVLDIQPASYFRATLIAHQWVKNDLSGVMSAPEPDNGDTTVLHVYHSLRSIEKMLFGTETPFDATIKDCCLYTEYIEKLLGSDYRCCIH
tara:strand:+ start:5587 stop:5883 length:297 start_codon:yes stop_codon:yes gene_type:complete